jgi:hypothetical protein
MKVRIKDYFKDTIEDEIIENPQDYSFVVDLILYGLLIYYYYNGVPATHYLLLKYVIVIVVVRYICACFTDYQIYRKDNSEDTTKRYFQINLYLAIFVIVIVLMYKHNNLNLYLAITMIAAYTIMCSAVGNNFTIDNLFTVLFAYTLYYMNIKFLCLNEASYMPTNVYNHTSPSSVVI